MGLFKSFQLVFWYQNASLLSLNGSLLYLNWGALESGTKRLSFSSLFGISAGFFLMLYVWASFVFKLVCLVFKLGHTGIFDKKIVVLIFS